VIKLSSPENESFKYSCTMHPPNSSFYVHPSYGTINGETELTVSYQPTEFVTSSTNMQIVFSTFDRKLLKCKISGNCLPGLLTLKKKREFELKRKKIKPVEKRTTKDVSAQLAHLARDESSAARIKQQEQHKKPQYEQRIEPGAQHHVNRILNSKDKNAQKAHSHNQIYIDRSLAFRSKLRQALEAEKINKLRWQIRIGDEVPSFDELESVRQSRHNDTLAESELDRTEREANSVPSCTPNFDPYRNSPWRARHVALGQFQQAARTILIRIRGETRLSKLRKLMKLVNQEGLSIEAAETTLLEQMGRQIQLKVAQGGGTMSSVSLDGEDSTPRKRMTVNPMARPANLSGLMSSGSNARISVMADKSDKLASVDENTTRGETYNDVLHAISGKDRLTKSIAHMSN